MYVAVTDSFTETVRSDILIQTCWGQKVFSLHSVIKCKESYSLLTGTGPPSKFLKGAFLSWKYVSYAKKHQRSSTDQEERL